MGNLTELIVSVSDTFGCDWSAEDQSTERLAGQLASLLPLLDGFSRDARARIIALYIDERMHLDTDDAGEERLTDTVFAFLSRG